MLTPQYVFVSGRLTKEDIDCLEEMADDGSYADSRVNFPGVTLAYLKEDDSHKLFLEEHKSRNMLHNVVFKIKFDLVKGKMAFPPIKGQKHGTIKTCFNLHKLMDQNPEYDGKVLISRFLGKITSMDKVKDSRHNFKYHCFGVQ